jgi:hypothetical protein
MFLTHRIKPERHYKAQLIHIVITIVNGSSQKYDKLINIGETGVNCYTFLSTFFLCHYIIY